MLTEIVTFSTKKRARINYLSYFLNLNLHQPSSLIPPLTEVINAAKKKDPEMEKIAKVIKGLTPDEALF